MLEGEADHLDGGRETEFVEDIGLMAIDSADSGIKKQRRLTLQNYCFSGTYTSTQNSHFFSFFLAYLKKKQYFGHLPAFGIPP